MWTKTKAAEDHQLDDQLMNEETWIILYTF